MCLDRKVRLISLIFWSQIAEWLRLAKIRHVWKLTTFGHFSHAKKYKNSSEFHIYIIIKVKENGPVVNFSEIVTSIVMEILQKFDKNQM